MSSNTFSLGSGLRAAVAALQNLVDAIHKGYLSGSVAGNPATTRWTPSFVTGKGPTSANSKPYSALHLSEMLGNNRGSHSHPAVQMALDILELHELGELSREDMDSIYADADGLNSQLLHKVLSLTKEAHFQQEAVSVLSDCQ